MKIIGYGLAGIGLVAFVLIGLYVAQWWLASL